MKGSIKVFGPILLLGILIITAVGGRVDASIAYETRVSQVVNHFLVGNTEIEVSEVFDGVTKSDVKIINHGNIPIYVRAVVAIYWKDTEGNLLLDTPKETDYALTIASSDSLWEYSKEDGFFYYKSLLKPGEATSPLIEECRDLKTYEDARILAVDVAAQSIQEIPAKESSEVSE
jgi:hypothetical protein